MIFFQSKFDEYKSLDELYIFCSKCISGPHLRKMSCKAHIVSPFPFLFKEFVFNLNVISYQLSHLRNYV